jgi:hypothetical protein
MEYMVLYEELKLNAERRMSVGWKACILKLIAIDEKDVVVHPLGAT